MRESLKLRRQVSAAGAMAGILLFCAAAANAASPVAIVEDVTAAKVKAQAMDYLFEGDTLTLADGEEITISYLSSCAIEQISGGEATVAIGAEKSTVTGKGRVKRKFVECGGGGISLTRRQSDRAAGVVVRGGEGRTVGQPDVTVYSLHPVLKLSRPADSILLERLDAEEKRTLKVEGLRLDLANAGIKLAPGGVYRATAGDHKVVFKIATTARASNRNLISRLVEL